MCVLQLRTCGEKHLFMECNLYDDLRYNLFFEISKFIDNFHTLDIDTKFVKLMTCLDIQHYFCKILNKFYFRRKLCSQSIFIQFIDIRILIKVFISLWLDK